MKKTFYRVCHKDTLQGLWYDYQGNFTGTQQRTKLF
jgi:hypothetical protein